MKTIIVLLSILFCHSAGAQWKKIAYFTGLNEGNTYGEEVTYVYFLNLPGPLRIGFAGTQSELYKTTDGGKSWTKSWGDGLTFDQYFVTGICFKDTLTGWFSICGSFDGCYRTTDGGNSWTVLPTLLDSIYGAEGINYCAGTNRLLLSMDGCMEVSTDLGDSWKLVTSIGAGGISFSNDSIGIAAGYPTDSTMGLIRTTDGGMNWTLVDTSIACHQPLAIPGTPICFEADLEKVYIRRSDDYGQTWRIIKYFGPNSDCTGIIRGDTTRLYIQMDSSMYLSTDQGVTWENDGGPGSLGDVNADNGIFYSANGVTMAGSVTTKSPSSDAIVNGGGLWEETWPQAGVAENENTNSGSISVFPNPATNSITVMSSLGPLSIYDPLGRSYTVPRNGNALDISTLPAGVYFISDGVSRAKFVKTSR